MRLLLASRRVRRLTVAGATCFLLLMVAYAVATATANRSAAPNPFPPRWQTHLDRPLGRVVDSLARKRATAVWCWSARDWEQRLDPWRGRERIWKGPWGAYTTGGAVQLAPNECVVLKLLRKSRVPVWEWANPEALAWSTYVLAHESVHVAGYRNEQKATCWGLQRVDRTALALGRTAKEARYLAAVAWRSAYPRARPSYRSRECRDGGRLDLRPKSDVWP